ncbi:hypothetical protein C7974DRAFT_138889 [Boeremia exigua]|uniref:uncharacterized protein n=1 Tax=Boeremia exigua TaxID=749465 RepID=UPI001E8E2FE2|nr:uncharacterized protein C7974DRAFT_138889 [Boeremia exigua]KAH6639788.1 hypothetical protein C7974DRAFT_138889 [Boeremia exigua]
MLPGSVIELQVPRNLSVPLMAMALEMFTHTLLLPATAHCRTTLSKIVACSTLRRARCLQPRRASATSVTSLCISPSSSSYSLKARLLSRHSILYCQSLFAQDASCDCRLDYLTPCGSGSATTCGSSMLSPFRRLTSSSALSMKGETSTGPGPSTDLEP